MDLIARIHQHYNALKGNLPREAREHLYLTGGAAAFLFGSDRPFSDDLDFMMPEKFRAAIAKSTDLHFKINKKKPIFHSLLAPFEAEGITCSVILKSVVQPLGSRYSFAFMLDPEVEARQVKIRFKKDFIRAIPPEFLFLIKLLAGRGKTLGKYDLYDARQIFLKNKFFDLPFLERLVFRFCQPLSLSVPVLRGHLKTMRKRYPHRSLARLEEALMSFPLSPGTGGPRKRDHHSR